MIACVCQHCGRCFQQRAAVVNRGDGRFCSRSCAAKSRTGIDNPNWRGGGSALFNCAECGREVRTRAVARVNRGTKKFCSHECYGEFKKLKVGAKSPRWKGGRRISSGRILIYQPNHPRAQRCGCVLEHVLVAEKVIGKFLPAQAVIHHVNENTADNRNKNLVVCENQAYHMALHGRLRILRGGGNPWTDRFCKVCGWKTRTAFTQSAAVCKDCARQRAELQPAQYSEGVA